MRALTLISAALLTATGCSAERVVNTGEWATITTTSTSVAPVLPPTSPAHLADASEFVAHPDGPQAVYYFTTPSGRWHCAIVPRTWAGCQNSGAALGIADAPETVRDAAGTQTAPNAIVIGPQGEPYFAALEQPGFTLVQGEANVLTFNQTLIAARFRCNVQEATGVSCLSEASGKGFTFSADGYTPQYAEVPLDAP